MADSTNTLESYNPPVVDDRGKFLDERIKDVGAARSLWFRLQQADLKSNQQMAKVQAMVDGAPPLDQMQLAKQGLAYMSTSIQAMLKLFWILLLRHSMTSSLAQRA